MEFVDKALARRLESCEEMPQVLYARVFKQTRPDIGAAEEQICGGHMVFAGLGSPIGRATGVGFDQPLTSDDVDRIEQFYRELKAPSQVDLTPLHRPETFEMFKERGYAIAELNNVLYRKLDPQEDFPAPPAHCEIRRSPVEEAEVAGGIVESAFFPDGAPEAFRGLITPLYEMEDALPEAGGVWHGSRDSPAQGVCTLWGGHAQRFQRTGTADSLAAGSHEGSSRCGLPIRSSGHARSDHLAAQCGAAGVPRGIQQGNGD
jgi:hypothetical protein